MQGMYNFRVIHASVFSDYEEMGGYLFSEVQYCKFLYRKTKEFKTLPFDSVYHFAMLLLHSELMLH